jgi:hypothetical protein
MHSIKPSIFRLFFILFLLKELLKSVWFFRTTIPSVTPFRSLTRCAEPTGTGFIPTGIYVGGKTTLVSHAVIMSAMLELLTGTATLW